MASPSSHLVTVDLPQGEQRTVDMMQEGIETYGELLILLVNDVPDAMSERYRLTDLQGVELASSDKVEVRHVRLNRVTIVVYVRDENTHQRVEVDLETDTLRKVYDVFQQRTSRELEHLSFRGQQLDRRDTRSLAELGIMGGDELSGRMSVVVVDKLCELENLIDVYPFYTTLQLLDKYAEATNRLFNPMNVQLSLHGQPLDNLGASLFELQVAANQELEFENPPFVVSVHDKDQVVTIQVSDHTTVGEIKEAYVAQTQELLSPNDKLQYDNEDLDDDVQIYKRRINEGAKLYLYREEVIEQFWYVCADCGSDVKLKRYDAVQCRECGYRIVYKKRTQFPMQYLCR